MRLPEADCLLVVPPLAHLTWPALGVHQLQACAREAGFEVAILYMNALFASEIGPLAYAGLCNAPVHWLLGDRLFARAAYGAPPLGFETDAFLGEVAAHHATITREARHYSDHLTDSSGAAIVAGEYRYDDLAAWEEAATALVERVAEAIAHYDIVGATTTFDQTSACVALLSAVKRRRPDAVTVLGGANCDGEMARGVRSLTDAVDHVFSGESEATFVQFLRDPHSAGPIVQGAPCEDMDALPTTSYSSYFAQVPDLGETPLWVLYETSRGCWWGAKRHCTFCGLNANGMGFREKSPDRVVSQLREILAEVPTHRVCMTDNIMPHRYHKTLIPRLEAELPGVRIFYEQKANLTLSQVKGLYDAGCTSIQPGIESLDTPLLDRMRKGVLARQNIALLRYARSVGMLVKWNLLWGFPGDDADSYRHMAEILPLLRHLLPPQALAHLHVDRFSPYFEHPDEHGVTEIAPLPGYAEVFPADADLGSLAYHFAATYRAGSHEIDEVMVGLREEIARWWGLWEVRPPLLHVRRTAPGAFQLVDTRDLGGPTSLFLSRPQAEAALVGGPWERVAAGRWAVEKGLAVALDGWCVPLATADVALLGELEAEPTRERGMTLVRG